MNLASFQNVRSQGLTFCNTSAAEHSVKGRAAKSLFKAVCVMRSAGAVMLRILERQFLPSAAVDRYLGAWKAAPVNKPGVERRGVASDERLFVYALEVAKLVSLSNPLIKEQQLVLFLEDRLYSL